MRGNLWRRIEKIEEHTGSKRHHEIMAALTEYFRAALEGRPTKGDHEYMVRLLDELSQEARQPRTP